MTKIHLLPEDLSNKIAAGEVVERPASVVKELVENSIDAGATHIKVGLKGSGKAEILVEDDGEGMSREDALLSLKRHATSKISKADDLDRISTLGFRGEALPSIAAVGRMELVTKEEGAEVATRILFEGGEVKDLSEVAAPRGTRVTISELFYNIPARRKFLKTDATELRNVVEMMTHLALIHNAIGFELNTESRSILSLPRGQSLFERADEVSGVKGGLYWRKGERGGVKLNFAFAAPHEGRGHRRGVNLFVNRRAVNDKILFRAVMEGYRGLMESNRYPVALLWLEVSPDEVDVNVHPAKREVRFADEGKIFRAVSLHVAESLSESPWAIESEAPPSYEGYRSEVDGGAGRVEDALEGYAAKIARGGGRGFGGPAGGYGGGYRSLKGPSYKDFDREPKGLPFEGGHISTGTTSPISGREMESPYGRLVYLGAFDATYLLFEAPAKRELVIFDQHAAHERVMYEKFLEGYASSPGASLLVPIVMECSPAELSALDELRVFLENLGIKVERFGGNSISIVEAPSSLKTAGVELIVRNLLGGEPPQTTGDPVKDIAEPLCARAACAAAVKARRVLDESEVRELMARLSTLKNPTHCPHGRPLLVKLSRERVEGLFHRR